MLGCCILLRHVLLKLSVIKKVDILQVLFYIKFEWLVRNNEGEN